MRLEEANKIVFNLVYSPDDAGYLRKIRKPVIDFTGDCSSTRDIWIVVRNTIQRSIQNVLWDSIYEIVRSK